jgi:hypothetical protein
MKRIVLTLAVAGSAVAALAAGTSSAAVTSTNAKLTIQHVVRGCHVWSDGTHRAASMSLTLKRGSTLTIVDMDIDPHKLVQLGGPSLRLRGHMMMGGIDKVVFRKVGLYSFTTRTVEMGPMMDAKTIGPDNKLRLSVRVV